MKNLQARALIAALAAATTVAGSTVPVLADDSTPVAGQETTVGEDSGSTGGSAATDPAGDTGSGSTDPAGGTSDDNTDPDSKPSEDQGSQATASAESGEKQQKNTPSTGVSSTDTPSTDIPAETPSEKPSAPETPAAEEQKTGLADGDTITVSGYDAGTEGSDAVSGHAAEIHSQPEVEKTTSALSGKIDVSENVKDGTYVYKQDGESGYWTKDGEKADLAEGDVKLLDESVTVKNGDFFIVMGQKAAESSDAKAGSVTAVNGVSISDITIDTAVADGTYVYNADDSKWHKDTKDGAETVEGITYADTKDGLMITTAGKTDTEAGKITAIDGISPDGFTVDKEVKDGTYKYVAEKAATSESAGDAVTAHWELVNDAQTTVDADKIAYTETPEDGTTITIKGHKDAAAGTAVKGDVSYIIINSEVTFSLDDITVSKDLKDDTYTFNGTDWVGSDGKTVDAKDLSVGNGKKPVNGDTITTEGHKDAAAGKAATPGKITALTSKNGYTAKNFRIADDLGNGTYTYDAESKTWTSADKTDVTDKITFSEKAEEDKPSGDKGGTSGGSTTGGNTSGGSSSGNTSGGSTGGSTGGSSATGGSSSGSTSGGSGSTSDGTSDNNGGTSDNGGNGSNGGSSDNGGTVNPDAGKTSDEVSVPTTEDDVTGLDVASGSEVDGKYVTSDGIILVNKAVETADGIVITDADGAAVPANSKVKFNGKTYLINDIGVIAENEKVIVGKKTYVAKKDGTLAKKAFVTLQTRNRIYVNGKGQIVKNKAFKVGKSTYVAKKSGALVKNGTYRLGSKRYTVKKYKVTKTVRVRKSAKR